MKYSIVTPIFNQSHLTSQFIMGVAPHMDGDGELILVDNASVDNTLDTIRVSRKFFPRLPIRLLSNYYNVGFGTANNQGAQLARGEILIFISNDVQILGDFISPIVEQLGKQPNLAVGPRLITQDTGWNHFERFGTIAYLEGFCFATTKQNYTMVGAFDENIFIDGEDIDLSLRLHLAGVGLKQITLPVMHELGGSFKGLSQARINYTLRSMAYLETKWHTKRITHE